jgi:hypothetical protein
MFRFQRKDIVRPLVLVQSDFALILLLIAPCILSLFCIFNSLHTNTAASNFVVLAFFIGSIGLYRLSISKKLEEYLT